MDLDGLSGSTPLLLALKRGTQSGASLADELRNLGDHSIESKIDAEAVCDVLERLANDTPTGAHQSALNALIALFQLVESTECPAFPVMARRGTEILVQFVDDGLRTPPRHEADDVLFALEVLAMYGSRAGTDAVIRAARKPLETDSCMWSVIFSKYTSERPERERLFSELSDPLPTDFLAVALLDSANCAHQEGIRGRHPFDSQAGIRQLESWLTDTEQVSYAQSAAVSLPYINCRGRDALLALAFDHASVDVQIEAARVAAKLGREAGVKWLTRYCLDVKHSGRAQYYLRELGLESDIPSECQDAGFQSKAEFAHWLAHPNELGCPPDELEIVDHRELVWPPNRERKKLWLIKYRMNDATAFKGYDVGVGLVGSVTFCFFSYKLEHRSPEDAYAIHCYWEMRNLGLISEASVPEHSREFDHLLRQCKDCDFEKAAIELVAEFSQELGYPQRLIALAKATRRGVPGFLIADGPRSRWTAVAESPHESSDHSFLVLHIGRVLLNLNANEDIAR